MVDWIATMWGQHAGTILPSLLMVDSFSGPLVKSVHKLKDMHTNIAASQSDSFSVLQPLHASLNKPIKGNVRRLYTELMAGGNHTFNRGRIQAVVDRNAV